MAKMKPGNPNPDPHDTGVLPPGGMADGGGEMPDRGQRLNPGYGARLADLNRGHLAVESPEKHEDPHPQRDSFFEERPKGGFLARPGISSER